MPRKIRILPDHISQIIAAGEVVERPASVVKELMENAIDAGGSEIIVELEAGGLQSIRVVDNGEGMDREDAPVAFRRYATSKIWKSEDLYAIRTLGFRGEALPSIGQVSEVTLRTRMFDSLSGIQVVCEGGEVKKLSEIGCPVGTEVEVKNIFYNIPVKRKFLKSIRAELRYALQHFQRLSLAHPSISFKFIHDGRLLYDHPKTEIPLVRIEAIFGKEIYSHLRPIDFDNGEIKISGFASLPSFSKKNAEGIYFYVNQRFIKDRMIYRAVLDAYRHTLPGGQFPIVVLFITLPPSTIDVNVHPTKTEVKFRDPEKIYQAVLTSLRWRVGEESSSSGEKRSPEERKEIVSQGETQPSFFIQENLSSPSFPAWEKEEGARKVQEGEGGLWGREKKLPYSVLGQIGGTYILCEREGDLIFIDQHAAHERILFEKLKEEYESGSVVSEKMLIPLLMELSDEETALIESAGETFKSMGFEIEPMGRKLFALRSIPSLIRATDPQAVVRGILDDLSFLENPGKGEEILHAILIALACHTAVRGNFTLRKEEMDKLIELLIPFHPSTTCPHGRPIFFLLPWGELNKQFKRK